MERPAVAVARGALAVSARAGCWSASELTSMTAWRSALRRVILPWGRATRAEALPHRRRRLGCKGLCRRPRRAPPSAVEKLRRLERLGRPNTNYPITSLTPGGTHNSSVITRATEVYASHLLQSGILNYSDLGDEKGDGSSQPPWWQVAGEKGEFSSVERHRSRQVNRCKIETHLIAGESRPGADLRCSYQSLSVENEAKQLYITICDCSQDCKDGPTGEELTEHIIWCKVCKNIFKMTGTLPHWVSNGIKGGNWPHFNARSFSKVVTNHCFKQNDNRLIGLLFTARHMFSGLDDDMVPKQNMVFKDYDSVYDFYEKYAYHAGFDIRKSRTKKTIREICCSREGHHKFYKGDEFERERNHRTKKTGCKAYMKVKNVMVDGEVSSVVYDVVVLEHNHPLTPSLAAVKHMRSHKHTDDTIMEFVNTMQENRVAQNSLIGVLADMHGGQENIPFTSRNLENRFVSCICHLPIELH
uniref:FAR1 domain-containing protein n=1 Tax=Oryza sativa subsp. japonica TaxID=39947 RepID=H2KWC1_ORYSJ|nr:hypothetical protein LOC_Os11g02964 [Oryza sativa Japonica Group]